MRISDWSSDVCSSDLIVAGGFAGIHKEVRHKVGMRHVEAAIDDGNDGAGISGSELPSKVRIYIRVLKPVVLACVVEWPLPVEERVVRHTLPDIDEDVEVRCYIFRYSGICIGLGCREDVDIRSE